MKKEIARWIWLRAELKDLKLYNYADYIRATIEDIYNVKQIDCSDNCVTFTHNKLPATEYSKQEGEQKDSGGRANKGR